MTSLCFSNNHGSWRIVVDGGECRIGVVPVDDFACSEIKECTFPSEEVLKMLQEELESNVNKKR